MYRSTFDPFCDGWELFRRFMSCGAWVARRFYTRKEQLEQLERLKKKVEQELEGIRERIDDLKKQDAR
jgi:hypothetical protein